MHTIQFEDRGWIIDNQPYAKGQFHARTEDPFLIVTAPGTPNIFVINATYSQVRLADMEEGQGFETFEDMRSVILANFFEQAPAAGGGNPLVIVSDSNPENATFISQSDNSLQIGTVLNGREISFYQQNYPGGATWRLQKDGNIAVVFYDVADPEGGGLAGSFNGRVSGWDAVEGSDYATLAQVEGLAGGRPYKSYMALISQTGSGNPTADHILENQLGDEPTFSYNGTGAYKMILAGAFPANKTVIIAHPVNAQHIRVSRANDSEINIESLDISGSDPANDILLGTPIEVRVYE